MSNISPADVVAATGIEGLDSILGGGLPRNHLYLVEGATGTGKTTLGLQFTMEGVRRNERVLYITLSETGDELWGVAKSHGWSLDGVNLYELPSPEEDLTLDKRYTLFHPAEVEFGKVTKQIFAEVERIQPTRLVLDTLAGLRLLAQDPLHYREQMQSLRQFLNRRACTTLLLNDSESTINDYRPTSLVHGILCLERHLSDYGRARRRLNIRKVRGLDFVDSYHDCKLTTGGLIVYPHLVTAQHRQPFSQEQVSSNIAELDTLLGGGMDRGYNTLIMGPAGAGKSSVAMQYIMAAAGRGERSAVYLFDETVNAFLHRGMKLNMGITEQVDAGRILLTELDPSDMSPGEFAYHIQQRVEHDQVRLVVIDSLGGYFALAPTPFLNLRLHELLTYLNHHGVVTLLTLAQTGIIGSGLKSPLDLSSLADTVILLRFFEAYGQVRKAISVIKKRSGHHERTIRELWLDPKGMRVGEPLQAFQGILSGLPQYSGEQGPLLEKNHEHSG